MPLLIILFFCSVLASAQEIYITNIDQSDYPLISVGYVIAPTPHNTKDLRQKSDLRIRENGIERDIISLSCPQQNEKPRLSTVITTDISGSMKDKYLDIAKLAIKEYLDLSPLGKDEIALTSFNQGSYINQDFTSDYSRLSRAIDQLVADGGTDYNSALIAPPTGSLTILDKARFQPQVIFLTDGMSEMEYDKALDLARETGAVIHSLVIGLPCPKSLQDLSTATGGIWKGNIVSPADLNTYFQIINKVGTGKSVCSISYESEKDCNLSISVELTDLVTETNDLVTELKNPANISQLDISVNTLDFGIVEIGAVTEQKIRITAKNSSFSLFNMHCDDDNISVAPQNLFLPAGTEAEITVQYTPQDKSYGYTWLEMDGIPCNNRVFITYGDEQQRKPEMIAKIIEPNGGESFLAGSDTVIKWTGTSPTKKVRLDYSDNGGISWNIITNNATNLEHKWTPLPNITGDNYLVRINSDTFTLGGFQQRLITFPSHIQSFLGSVWDNDGVHIWGTANKKLYKFNIDDEKLVDSIDFPPFGITTFIEKDPYTNRIFVKEDNTNELISVEIENGLVTNRTGISRSNLNEESIKTHPFREETVISQTAGFSIYDSNFQKLKEFILTNSFGNPRDIEISPDGTKIAIIDNYSNQGSVLTPSIFILDYENLSFIDTISYHNSNIFNLSWSHDSRYLSLSGAKVGVYIHDTYSGKQLRHLEWEIGLPVWTTEFHPSEPIIAAAFDGGKFYLGNILTGEEYVVQQPIFSITTPWSPQGNRLLSNLFDRKAIFLYEFDAGDSADESDSEFSIIAPEIHSIDVDMESETVGMTKTVLVPDFLENKTGYPKTVVIKELFFEGGNADEFSVAGGQFPTFLEPNEKRAVEFVFTPNSLGNKFSRIITTSSGISDTATIRGQGERASLEPISDLIDFGTVEVGDIKGLTQELVKNISGQSLEITKVVMQGPDLDQFGTSITGPIVLGINESLTAEALFAPLRNGRTSGSIAFHYNGSGSPLMIPMYGAGLGAVIEVSDGMGMPGESVPFQIILKNNELKGLAQLISGIELTLRNEASILTSNEIQTQPRILGDSIFTNYSVAIPGMDKKIITTLSMTGGLGRVTETTLDIVDAKLLDNSGLPIDYEIETYSGLFTLEGICYEGEARLVDMSASPSDVAIHYNEGNIEMKYIPAELGNVTVSVAGIDGSVIPISSNFTILELEPITKNISCPNLAIGIYYLNLITESRVITSSFVVN